MIVIVWAFAAAHNPTSSTLPYSLKPQHHKTNLVAEALVPSRAWKIAFPPELEMALLPSTKTLRYWF